MNPRNPEWVEKYALELHTEGPIGSTFPVCCTSEECRAIIRQRPLRRPPTEEELEDEAEDRQAEYDAMAFSDEDCVCEWGDERDGCPICDGTGHQKFGKGKGFAR